MVSVADYLVCDVCQISWEVRHIRSIVGIRLKEFVPQEDSVPVCQIVEVRASALANPVADDVEICQGMHVELCVEPFARDAFHAFVQAPIPAPSHHPHSVNGK